MNTTSLWNGDVNPWQAFFDWPNHLDRALEQERAASPAYDIYETESHFLVSVDLPGISKKDIAIEVKDNQLSVTAERKSEKRSRKFQRYFTLPTGLDAEKFEAQYQDGVLTLALPKAEAAKARQIKISDGKSSFFGKLVGAKKDETASASAA